LTILFNVYQNYRYEESLYKTIVQQVSVPENPRKTFESLVNTTFSIQFFRNKNLDLQGIPTIKGNLIRSGDLQLLDGVGACGNYAHILAELCLYAGFEPRLVQLSGAQNPGSHIIVEALVDGKWAAADALFKVIYYNSDSSFASMNDVVKNSLSFSSQVPADYPYKIDYQKFTYTNWDKIPYLMPALRKLLVLGKGEEWVSSLSLRSYFLNMHRSLFYILMAMYVALSAYTISFYFRLKRAV
jgi:hypothetical protein